MRLATHRCMHAANDVGPGELLGGLLGGLPDGPGRSGGPGGLPGGLPGGPGRVGEPDGLPGGLPGGRAGGAGRAGRWRWNGREVEGVARWMA